MLEPYLEPYWSLTTWYWTARFSRAKWNYFLLYYFCSVQYLRRKLFPVERCECYGNFVWFCTRFLSATEQWYFLKSKNCYFVTKSQLARRLNALDLCMSKNSCLTNSSQMSERFLYSKRTSNAFSITLLSYLYWSTNSSLQILSKSEAIILFSYLNFLISRH